MTISESDRLANEPVFINTADGRRLQLHYGFGGLRRIEEKFGSVAKLFEALGSGPEGNMYSAIFGALECGLWRQKFTEEQVDEAFDPAEIAAYVPIVTDSLMRSFPQSAQEAAVAPGKDKKKSSTGPTSTISPPSDSVEPIASFG